MEDPKEMMEKMISNHIQPVSDQINLGKFRWEKYYCEKIDNLIKTHMTLL